MDKTPVLTKEDSISHFKYQTSFNYLATWNSLWYFAALLKCERMKNTTDSRYTWNLRGLGLRSGACLNDWCREARAWLLQFEPKFPLVEVIPQSDLNAKTQYTRIFRFGVIYTSKWCHCLWSHQVIFSDKRNRARPWNKVIQQLLSVHTWVRYKKEQPLRMPLMTVCQIYTLAWYHLMTSRKALWGK